MTSGGDDGVVGCVELGIRMIERLSEVVVGIRVEWSG